MPDLIMLVDTALSEVPVNIMPLVDDTDFKTIEGAVAYNAAGMALRWHFVTTGGAYTVTSVTPTTGGDYDWTDQGDSGVYTIEIPASGGASINNDTEGFGWFTGVVTGVLPWRGPIIQFSPANVVNSLVNGSDKLEIDVMDINGDSGGVAGFDRATRTIGIGTVDTGATLTSIPTSSLSPAASVADQFKGRILIFTNTTSTAALRGQASDITASAVDGTLTVTSLTTAPASGDVFVIQ